MSSFNDGGPAFPRLLIGSEYTGMNVRTWLAGQALAGLCANPMVLADLVGFAKENPATTMAASLGKMATNIADATLAELAKEKEP